MRGVDRRNEGAERPIMGMKAGSIGGMVVMALVWGFIWMLPGGAIEAVDNVAPAAHGFTRRIDMWPQTLGIPGLIGGVIFGVLLAIWAAAAAWASAVRTSAN